jgi:hypothetical protein
MIKTEFPGFMKDDTPGRARAVLNIDSAGLQAYKDARAKELALTQVVEEVNGLKQDMTDIKRMLEILTNGKA